jgi:ubiquinone/menaquinone biosynthesis C-methylase UbiE
MRISLTEYRLMKGRESGMPEEALWETFFDADAVIVKLVCPYVTEGTVVEFGSGYGTFTIPSAYRTNGRVVGFDIDPDMIAIAQQKVENAALENITLQKRDFMESGTGLPANTVDHVMLYNILHVESPEVLLSEAYRILCAGGAISVMHWRSDIPTPRGPALEIRPSLQQCRHWVENAGFAFVSEVDLSTCCKYHYGFVAVRPD